jgi:CheY-like chemotaxis protein
MTTFNVLLVSRNGVGVEAVRSFFPGASLNVTTALDGLDCLSKLRDLRPDLVVLKPPLLWGGCDGILSRVREGSDLPPVPVLLLPDPTSIGGPDRSK